MADSKAPPAPSSNQGSTPDRYQLVASLLRAFGPRGQPSQLELEAADLLEKAASSVQRLTRELAEANACYDQCGQFIERQNQELDRLRAQSPVETKAHPSPECPGETFTEADALHYFTEYFVANYPGPDTIIHDPKWHAPKLFRAALHAIRAASHPSPLKATGDQT